MNFPRSLVPHFEFYSYETSFLAQIVTSDPVSNQSIHLCVWPNRTSFILGSFELQYCLTPVIWFGHQSPEVFIILKRLVDNSLEIGEIVAFFYWDVLEQYYTTVM